LWGSFFDPVEGEEATETGEMVQASFSERVHLEKAVRFVEKSFKFKRWKKCWKRVRIDE